LMDLGIKDLLPKVVFDGKGEDGTLGNRLESAFIPLLNHSNDAAD